MPGQLGDGVTATRDVSLTNSKAFCEGRQAKQNNLLVGSNPHPANSEAYAAWAAGFALTAATGLQGPCNITPAATVPNLVGATVAAARVTLGDAYLVLGTITLTTGAIASQLPAAATVVPRGTAVNVTLTS